MPSLGPTPSFRFTARDFREAARTARDPFIWQALRDLAEDYEALAAGRDVPERVLEHAPAA
jgi:hypothetical protein